MDIQKTGDRLVATFAATPTSVTPEGMMRFRGPAFKAGSYPDKDLVVTPEELHGIVERFHSPVAMNLAHKDSRLDGHFGRITDVWVEDDYLFSEVEKPAWLHAVMPETRVSVEIPLLEEPRLIGCAWTSSPVVKDAQLVAAFSDFAEKTEEGPTAPPPVAAFAGTRHDTDSGQYHIQQMHDMAAAAGAVCQRPSRADMASAHEAKALQAMHDTAVEHGAHCQAASTDRDYPRRFFSRDRRTTRMNLSDFLAKLAGQAKADGIIDEDVQIDPATFSRNEDPRVQELAAKFSEQEKLIQTQRDEMARFKAERIQSEAALFADGQIDALRILPKEKEQLIALYVQAATDDGERPATFAEGKSRVALLKDAYSIRDQHTLTTETVKIDKDGKAVFSETETPQVDADRPMNDAEYEAFLGKTSYGRALLDERKKAATTT